MTKVTIVGGLGGMGRFMGRLLSEAGHEVETADIKSGPMDWTRVGKSEVVLLAVPVSSLEAVAAALGPESRPEGVVIDICSLKTAPVSAMLKHCRGEVIGSHPLFGPNTEPLDGQVVFLCPARTGPWLSWYKDFLAGLKLRIVEIEPVEHDRLMARIQVLRHLLLFAFGLSLSRLDFDPARHLDYSGPWFNGLMDMLSHQIKQPPDLYVDLVRYNPEGEPVISEFVRCVGEVARTMRTGDSRSVHQLMTGLKSYLARDERSRQDGRPADR
ncbi:MAG: prephenate dehydrogenase/arogenate dehydrogenase family protein [Thermodesulfobacteriota bacterium]